MVDWKLNGYIIANDPRKLPALLLEALPDLQFRSTEALCTLYTGFIEISLEMAKLERVERKGGQRAMLTRYINQSGRLIQRIPTDRPQLLSVLYERILVAEGHGLLRGFGFGNRYGDSLAGNSEYVSVINKKETLKNSKEESEMKSRKELVKAAKELNEVLGLDPQIDIKAKPKELTAKIEEAAPLVDLEHDDLTEDTLEVLLEITKVSSIEETPKKEEEFKESTAAVEIAEKAEAEKKGKKGATSTKKESGELSNKAKVYQAWQKNETDITKLSKIVAGAVKDSTIKSWGNQWKNGKNLPAIAKK